MIPECIVTARIAESIQHIIRDGFPPQGWGRGSCLVENGNHLPPKYAISVAHRIRVQACRIWLAAPFVT